MGALSGPFSFLFFVPELCSFPFHLLALFSFSVKKQSSTCLPIRGRGREESTSLPLFNFPFTRNLRIEIRTTTTRQGDEHEIQLRLHSLKSRVECLLLETTFVFCVLLLESE